MTRMFKGGTYLLVAAFVVAFLLSGGIAKADGVDHHDDSQWSSNNGDGSNSNFKNSNDDGDWNGWENGDRDGNGDCDQGGGGKDRDPKSTPEPSSLALLSVGMFGLAAFARRQKITLTAPKAL